MDLIAKAVIVGGIVGALCTKLNLPLPAPNSFVGIAGILGIYGGYVITSYFMK
jgi:XapX domain-containing protein